MGVRKLSVALDEIVVVDAKRSAARSKTSLSAWLNRAAKRELTIERGLAAVRKFEDAHGSPSALELARADAVLARFFDAPRKPKRARR